jgi:hypothetical protein
MRRVERSLLLVAVIVVCICLLPVIGFMLTSLWPQRLLVSWLLLGLVILVILVRLASLIIKTRTIARVRLSEEALRPGRLYAHERLVEHEDRHNDEWTTQQQQARSETYSQSPYVYAPYRQSAATYEADNTSYKNGLQSLGMNSYDWEEKL